MPGLSVQYEDFLRASVDWTWECDSSFNIASLSSSFTALLGCPGDDFYTKPLTNLFERATENDEEFHGSLQRCLIERRAFRHLPVRITGLDGGTSLVLINGLPYYNNETGKFMGFRGTAVKMPALMSRDTEDSEANQRLLALLEIALKRKDELELNRSAPETQDGAKEKDSRAKLGPLAHELKTPLNAILGFSEIIRDQRMGEELDRYSAYAHLIHESGAHLLEVLEDLLELAENGKKRAPDPLIDLVDPASVGRFALSILKDEADSERITLVDQMPSKLPHLRIEKRKLRQILLNLLSNAIKYTPKGGEVTLSAEVYNDKTLRMTVTDTGIGVRKEDWKRIFKRNVQTTEAQRLGNGRGLGLAIASDLAAAFGGNISLESTSGVGSRFTLSLPLGERPALDKEITITRKRAVKWEGQDQKSPKDMH